MHLVRVGAADAAACLVRLRAGISQCRTTGPSAGPTVPNSSRISAVTDPSVSNTNAAAAGVLTNSAPHAWNTRASTGGVSAIVHVGAWISGTCARKRVKNKCTEKRLLSINENDGNWDEGRTVRVQGRRVCGGGIWRFEVVERQGGHQETSAVVRQRPSGFRGAD